MKSKIIISEAAPEALTDYFENKGFKVVLFKGMSKPYEAVSSHPDMFMFYDEKLFIDEETTQVLSIGTIKGESIGSKYPENIKYNICKIGNYIICKYEYVAKEIKNHIKEKGYEVLNVNQGYAKCSTCIIDDSSVITSDISIKTACLRKNIDVLLIEPGHIVLKGLSYGFVGGASVAFDDVVFFNGDITKHPGYKKINNFIKSKNKRIEYLDYPLEDLGSFIIINE